MIYSKHITEITWEDIVDFCSQEIVEGATLDYKREFPQDLPKTIAAFANTMGGIILLGISESNENKPLLPIQGIPFERGLSEKVMSMILSNITPPIIPEIQICSNEDKSRAVIVIRIPQSDQTPHAIKNNTRVYIRTGNRNNYEELISIDKLQWLLSNRNKSLLFREELIRNCDERFNKYFEKGFRDHILGNNPIEDLSRLTLILSPVFPSNYICTPPQLKQILEKIYVPDNFYTSRKFPIDKESYNSVFYQNGLTTSLFVESFAYYTDLNSFGIYFYKQNMFRRFYEPVVPQSNIIRVKEVILRMGQFFDSANLFYQQLGFHGLLRFDFRIDGLTNFKLQVVIEECLSTIERTAEYNNTCLSSELVIKKKDFIDSSIRNLGWTYNINIQADLF